MSVRLGYYNQTRLATAEGANWRNWIPAHECWCPCLAPANADADNFQWKITFSGWHAITAAEALEWETGAPVLQEPDPEHEGEWIPYDLNSKTFYLSRLRFDWGPPYYPDVKMCSWYHQLGYAWEYQPLTDDRHDALLYGMLGLWRYDSTNTLTPPFPAPDKVQLSFAIYHGRTLWGYSRQVFSGYRGLDGDGIDNGIDIQTCGTQEETVGLYATVPAYFTGAGTMNISPYYCDPKAKCSGCSR